MGVEQSNSSVVLDEQLVLKLYRRIEPGVNPELEVLRFLTDRGLPAHRRPRGLRRLRGQAARGDARDPAAVRARARRRLGAGARHARRPIRAGCPAHARRLGEVTALLHNALASDPTDPHFAPEEPSTESLALLSASIDEEIEQVFSALPDTRRRSRRSRGRGEEVRDRLRALTHIGQVGRVIRHHGDYHLGQALWTKDEDWLDPRLRGRAGALAARAAAEALAAARRRRDAALVRLRGVGVGDPARRRGAGGVGGAVPAARSSTATWRRSSRSLLPTGEQAIERLLTVFELEKAVYELRYELAQPARLGLDPGRRDPPDAGGRS